MFDQVKPFAIALLIGLIIGIEREHSHPEGSQAFGVRTFVLLSLMGALAAYLHEPMLDIIISIFVFGLIIAGYFRTTSKTLKSFNASLISKNARHKKQSMEYMINGLGLTTEFSAGAVYCLGYIAFYKEFLALVIAVFVLLILVTRKRLRAFSRHQLKSQEIQAASILLVIGLGILPFLPNRSIDPWNLFNPHVFGMLFLAIALIQFGGYVAIRMIGEKLGLVLTGFFGGLVSSTAIFVTVPKLVRDDASLQYPAIAACLLATTASLAQFLVILYVVSFDLFESLVWPVCAMCLTGILSGIILIREKHTPVSAVHTLNPLDLKSAARFSSLLAGMIFLVGFTRKYLGLQAFQLLNFLGGLFETHSMTFATANLFANHQLIFLNAKNALGLIILGSLFSKIVLLWLSARNRFALMTTGFLSVMFLAGASVYFFVI